MKSTMLGIGIGITSFLLRGLSFLNKSSVFFLKKYNSHSVLSDLR